MRPASSCPCVRLCGLSEILKGAIGVGGAQGTGRVYEKGKFIGDFDHDPALDRHQAGWGLRDLPQLIFFENKAALPGSLQAASSSVPKRPPWPSRPARAPSGLHRRWRRRQRHQGKGCGCGYLCQRDGDLHHRARRPDVRGVAGRPSIRSRGADRFASRAAARRWEPRFAADKRPAQALPRSVFSVRSGAAVPAAHPSLVREGRWVTCWSAGTT